MGMTVFFGGTFNPPHNAHKKMLSTALRLPYVDKILVVPTNIPPHKAVKGYFACNDDRMKMCRMINAPHILFHVLPVFSPTAGNLP